ncbi:MAG: ABC transporter ATP-binding protein [Syntrophomonadaceae bacterium]|nr:ABC transporter ATP-binding protein [Syntrophomonadaceae bacterium]
MEKQGLPWQQEIDRELLVRFENVSKAYSMGDVRVDALKDITFEIYEGELLVILGPSGSGKTTLLNLLGGMDQASGGRVWFQNRDLTKADDKELTSYRRREVGFVFQFYNLIPDLTVGENIEIVADLVAQPLEIDEVLTEVGLKHKKDSFPSQLSGGEQQRVSIARALVKKPRLLLCDEPTGALDDQTGKMILVLLETIARKTGGTVAIVTHNNAITPMADRVLKMRNGQIVEIIRNYYPEPAKDLVF